eukprot:TRINITY_DN54276_c0_g1_i1.p1 TRINITY_DN54276_c0_g1~~TRINITY_DN54276_c0_g1_i1.p1  ORF type:complete len:261 (+),score=51.49 TRINITY_DN54276_c0_g1_i1:33-785(+)
MASRLLSLSSRSRGLGPLCTRRPPPLLQRNCEASKPAWNSSSSRSFASLGRAPSRGEDPWQVLGVSRQASAKEIKAAYRLAALRTHPDREGGSEDAFKRAALAYDALTNGQGLQGWNETASPVASEFDAFRADRFAPLRTVSFEHAERMFRNAFGGRGVDEVLQSAMEGEDHGLHAAAMREAAFNKLLRQAQAQSELHKLLGDGQDSLTTTTREVITTEDGKSFLKVRTTTQWLDGRTEHDIVVKSRHRM